MAESDVKKGLTAAVKAFLAAQQITAIEWPNKVLDLDGVTSWAKVSIVPNNSEPVTLGQGGMNRQTGFVQIDFHIPAGKGDKLIDAFQDGVEAEFIAGKTYTKNAVIITINSSGTTPGGTVDNWFRIIATIIYRSDLQRQPIT